MWICTIIAAALISLYSHCNPLIYYTLIYLFIYYTLIYLFIYYTLALAYRCTVHYYSYSTGV